MVEKVSGEDNEECSGKPRPRALLSIFENFNTLCEECELPAAADDDDDVPVLLL